MKVLRLTLIGIITLLIASCEFTQPENHTYVDLGLSVNWATCNIGADKPEDAGDYFAWGEVYSSNGTIDGYKWYDDIDPEISYISKYNPKEDNKITLETSDDVARRKWGYEWRMPTLSEMEELVAKCTWNFTNRNGVPGYNVIGPNGNSIFLPMSGHVDLSQKHYVGHSGFYWTSSLYKGDCNKSYSLRFTSSDNYVTYIERYIAQTVRAVRP